MDKNNSKSGITVSHIIPATVTAVWEVISRSGNVSDCHPFCKDNPVEKWPGATSKDKVIYYNDLVFDRVFTDWYDRIGYNLLIGRKSIEMAVVLWRIKEIDNDNSELAITIQPKPANIFPSYPKLIRWIPSIYLRFQLKKYLQSVVKGYNYYITTGKPVSRNQFGSHKTFSPKITKSQIIPR